MFYSNKPKRRIKMDIGTLKKFSTGYDEAKAKFYKSIFNLSKEPVVKTQCCNDDPTFVSESGIESCTAGMITAAQEALDAGKPVVLELFGRRTIDDGGFNNAIMTDTVTVYVPGQKIDRQFFKNMMSQEMFDATPPDKKRSREEREATFDASVKEAAEALKKTRV